MIKDNLTYKNRYKSEAVRQLFVKRKKYEYV